VTLQGKQSVVQPCSKSSGEELQAAVLPCLCCPRGSKSQGAAVQFSGLCMGSRVHLFVTEGS
jgi:hypothetical protein